MPSIRSSPMTPAAVSSADDRARVLRLALLSTLTVSLVLLVRAHLGFLRPVAVPLNDEAYITAFANRMLDGRMLPYVDAISHRGPILYWVAAAAVFVFGAMSWVPLRVASLAVSVALVSLVLLCGHRAHKPFVGAVATFVVTAVLTGWMMPDAGVAYNGDPLFAVTEMAALLALVVALDRRRVAPSVGWVAASGVMASIAVLTKQVAVLAIVPLGLWVVATALGRAGLAQRTRRALVVGFACGVALPFAVLVLVYGLAGELRALAYWTITYNLRVYMHPYGIVDYVDWLRIHRWAVVAAAPLILWGCSIPVRAARGARDLFRAYDEDGLVPTVALGAAAASLGAMAALRDFQHYFIPAVPWFALLVGLLIERALARTSDATKTWVVAAGGVFTVVVVTARTSSNVRERAAGAWPDPVSSPICAAVREHSSERDPIFVWGHAPELYVGCRRRAASRYVFTTVVAGLVPWFLHATLAEDDALAVPGSRATLIADLERSNPPLILDVPQSMGDRPMRRYAELASWLDAHYCAAGVVDGVSLYSRRSGAAGPCMP